MDKKTKKILIGILVIIVLYLVFSMGYLEGHKKGRKPALESYEEGLKFNTQSSYDIGFESAKNKTLSLILNNCYDYYCNYNKTEWQCLKEQDIEITKSLCLDIVLNKK